MEVKMHNGIYLIQRKSSLKTKAVGRGFVQKRWHSSKFLKEECDVGGKESRIWGTGNFRSKGIRTEINHIKCTNT